MDHCDACQFVYADLHAHALPTRLATFGARYRALLLPPDRSAVWDQTLRTRPSAQVWSALEYACHVRDVFLVQRDRIYAALVEDKPVISPMHREQRVTLARYNAQDPIEVVSQLATAAQLIAQAFAVLDPVQLQRLCVYNFPAPMERSLLWVGQHVTHEGVHHYQDITQVLAAVRAPGSNRTTQP